MSIAKRYGVNEEAIKAMIKDGVLPCSVVKCDQIISSVQDKITAGVSKTEAVKLTSEEAEVSIQYVYRILNKFQ